jgi:lysophospholipase L1-like esterase
MGFRRTLGWFLLPAVLMVGSGGCASRIPREVVYAAFGASDAVGIGAVPLKNGYVWRIRDDLEREIETVRLINLGVPAADVRGVEDLLTLALESGLRPDLVTVWVGTNDVIAGGDPDEFEDRLENILRLLRGKTEARVVVADVPDLTQIPRFARDPDPFVTRARVDAVNRAIHRLVEAFDAHLVPMADSPVIRECVSDVDGFHPNNRGHAKIAETFLQVIRPLLGIED